MLVSKRLDQVHQVGVLHPLWSEDVPLVQLLHRPRPVNNNDEVRAQNSNPGAGVDSGPHSQEVCERRI